MRSQFATCDIQPYDRTNDAISLDESERTLIYEGGCNDYNRSSTRRQKQGSI